MTIVLTPEQAALVKKILTDHLPGRAVRVFGSRVKGTVKRYADLDLCIMGDEPVAHAALLKLIAAFRESDLPFRVDVVEWRVLNEALRREVTERSEPIT
ncbi:MAG TPA: nucleotidyltransferase domain-containing protein [bacterium]|nr:nucleotidyltransferase domain-containing protein [bacterium]